MRIENRVDRIERELGMDGDEDKPVVLEVASGERFTVTPRQLQTTIDDIHRTGSRFLPKGAQP